jgi:putative membrane protein
MDSEEDAEQEPDVRFCFANERTFLAWNRTALALIATGIAATQLLPQFHITAGRRILGIPLVVLGAWVAAASFGHWRSNQRAMRKGDPLPSPPMPLILTVGIMAVGIWGPSSRGSERASRARLGADRSRCRTRADAVGVEPFGVGGRHMRGGAFATDLAVARYRPDRGLGVHLRRCAGLGRRVVDRARRLTSFGSHGASASAAAGARPDHGHDRARRHQRVADSSSRVGCDGRRPNAR